MFRKGIRLFMLAGLLVPLVSTVAGAQSVSDDVGPDGLKRRGDGSIDDTQPGDSGGGGGAVDDFVRVGDRLENREPRDTDPPGTIRREREDVHMNPATGVTRERKRSRVRRPDGSETRVRTERFLDADGNVLSVTPPRVRERGADRADRAEREDRVERPERAERPDRPDRAERPDRPERAERPERPERTDRSG